MNRLFLTLTMIATLLALNSVTQAQMEKDIGKPLFKNGFQPCAAGIGRVAFLRIDPKIPGNPVELFVGDTKTLTEKRALPGHDFRNMITWPFAWSPDGKDILIQEKVNGVNQIFKYKEGEKTGTQVGDMMPYRESMTQEELDAAMLSEDQLLSIAELSYSPSGKKILYTMNRPGKNAIWWMDLTTGKTRQATEDKCGYGPSFLPDEDRFTYCDNIIKEGITSDEDILLRSIKTGDVDTLIHTRAMESSGSNSPDGKYIVFVKTVESSNNLYVMKYATKEIKQITFAPNGKHCLMPCWSPDGKVIYFQGNGFFQYPSIFSRDFTPF